MRGETLEAYGNPTPPGDAGGEGSLTNVPTRIFSYWAAEQPRVIQSHARSTDARVPETAAAISGTLTGSTIPATAVTMA